MTIWPNGSPKDPLHPTFGTLAPPPAHAGAPIRHKRGGKKGGNDPPVGAASAPTTDRCLRGRSGAAAPPQTNLPGAIPRLSPPLLPNLSSLHNLLLPTQRTTREISAGRFCDGLARDCGGRAGSYDPRGGYPAPALHKPRQAGSPTRSSRRTFSGLCLPRATTT